MAIIGTIQFKRGKKSALISKLRGDFKPKQGEPIYELPEDGDTEEAPKLKIGNGIDDYENLPYTTIEIFYFGYHKNGSFYEDFAGKKELPLDQTKIYIAFNESYRFYKYYGVKVGFIPLVQNATEEAEGVMKLYKTNGINEDGTMTQKAITDGVNRIKFALETTADDDGDGNPENVLVLTLPWV